MAIRRLIHQYSDYLARLACLIALLSASYATTLPDLTNNMYNFTVHDGEGAPCLQASFELNFFVYYYNGSEYKTASIEMPNSSNVTVSGHCANSEGFASINLTWCDGNEFSTNLTFFNFSGNNNWTLYQIKFIFNASNKNYFGGSEEDDDLSDQQLFYTEKANLFNRTVLSDQFFYCSSCKKFYFVKDSGACQINSTNCSYVTLSNAVIFLGNYKAVMPDKQVCYEDWVAARETFVPIAVGGFLTLLLVTILLAYTVAFIRRYLKEKGTFKYSKM